MRDRAHREQQWEQRYALRIGPVNLWIDSVVLPDRWMPYIAPIYSVEARVVTVLRDPGKATDWQKKYGTRTICGVGS